MTTRLEYPTNHRFISLPFSCWREKRFDLREMHEGPFCDEFGMKYFPGYWNMQAWVVFDNEEAKTAYVLRFLNVLSRNHVRY